MESLAEYSSCYETCAAGLRQRLGLEAGQVPTSLDPDESVHSLQSFDKVYARSLRCDWRIRLACLCEEALRQFRASV